MAIVEDSDIGQHPLMQRWNAQQAHEFLETVLSTPCDGDDAIKHISGALLHLLRLDPESSLEIAYDKLHVFKFGEVPLQWRRLYEDAAL